MNHEDRTGPAATADEIAAACPGLPAQVVKHLVAQRASLARACRCAANYHERLLDETIRIRDARRRNTKRAS